MADINQEARIPVYINDEQARSALNNLTNEAEKWKKKMYEASAIGDMKGMKEAERNMNRAKKAAGDLSREAFNVNEILKHISSASINDLKKATTALDREMKGLNRDTKEYQALAAKKLQINEEFTKINGSLRTHFGLMDKLKGLMPALGIGAAVGLFMNLGRQIISVRGEFEKYEAVLTNTLGSNKAAKKELAMLSEFAAKTPFALTELTGAFVKLTNYGLKPSREEMRKYGDLASSVGKGFDQLVEAVADATTFEFERLKEFGIKAKKEGDKITFTFKEQSTVVDANTQAIKNYMLSLGDLQGVSGAMAAISETLGGRISNIGDAWDRVLNKMGEGTNGLMVPVLTGIQKDLDDWSKLFDIWADQRISKWEGFLASFSQVQMDKVWNKLEYLRMIDEMQSVEQRESTTDGSALDPKKIAEKAKIEADKRAKAAAEKKKEKPFKFEVKPLEKDPFAPDEEKPIDDSWIKSWAQADIEKFAEKKRSEAEWTAFLDKEVQKQIDIRNKEYEFDKEIAAAQNELKSVRMDAIGQIAGALSGMFEQGSAAQIAFMAIEKAAAIAQIIFQTSIANAKAVALSPLTFGQPWVSINTISAGASIAGIVAQSISQVASAKKSGYYDGGFTGWGNSTDVAGAVHKNEYVIPAEGLRNPKVSAFANYIEVARRNNQLARLDLSPYFAAYSSGGFTSKTPIGRVGSTPQKTPQGEPLTAILERVAIALDENTKQTRRLESWKPKVYSELIKKDIDTLNDIQKNRGL